MPLLSKVFHFVLLARTLVLHWSWPLTNLHRHCYCMMRIVWHYPKECLCRRPQKERRRSVWKTPPLLPFTPLPSPLPSQTPNPKWNPNWPGFTQSFWHPLKQHLKPTKHLSSLSHISPLRSHRSLSVRHGLGHLPGINDPTSRVVHSFWHPLWQHIAPLLQWLSSLHSSPLKSQMPSWPSKWSYLLICDTNPLVTNRFVSQDPRSSPTWSCLFSNLSLCHKGLAV